MRRVKNAQDPLFRTTNRLFQALSMEFARIEQDVVQTALVETREEAQALRRALITHARDPEKGLERFRFQDRAGWRHVQQVLARAPVEELIGDREGTGHEE